MYVLFFLLPFLINEVSSEVCLEHSECISGPLSASKDARMRYNFYDFKNENITMLSYKSFTKKFTKLSQTIESGPTKCKSLRPKGSLQSIHNLILERCRKAKGPFRGIDPKKAAAAQKLGKSFLEGTSTGQKLQDQCTIFSDYVNDSCEQVAYDAHVIKNCDFKEILNELIGKPWKNCVIQYTIENIRLKL